MDNLPCSAIASHSESFLSRGNNDSKPSSRSRSLNGFVKVTAPLPAACIAHEVNQPLLAETTDASACIRRLAAANCPIVLTRTTCANCTAAHQRVLSQLPGVGGARASLYLILATRRLRALHQNRFPFDRIKRGAFRRFPFVSTVRASVCEIKLDAITIMPANAPTMRNPYIALPPRTSLTALNRQQLIVTGRWKVTCGEPAPAVVY